MERKPNLVCLEAVSGMAIRSTVPVADLPGFLARSFGRLGEYIGRAGGEMAGPPFAVYHRVSGDLADVEAVFEVVVALPAEDGISAVEIPGGEALEFFHAGPSDDTSAAYAAIEDWLRANGREADGPAREFYYAQPEDDAAAIEIHIVQPIR